MSHEFNQKAVSVSGSTPCYTSSCGRVVLYLGDCLEIADGLQAGLTKALETIAKMTTTKLP